MPTTASEIRLSDCRDPLHLSITSLVQISPWLWPQADRGLVLPRWLHCQLLVIVGVGAYQHDTQTTKTTQSRHRCVTDGKTSEVAEAKITCGFWPLLPLASCGCLYYVGRANILLGSKLVCPGSWCAKMS
jgi:hypothetical protein